MNYAWEILLQADKEEIGRDSIRFTNAGNPSPYMELSMENLNADSVESQIVEINPLYRFGRELGNLFGINLTGMEQTRRIFFDICIHYISQLDLREGLSRRDFYLELLREDIQTERFSEGDREAFPLFSKEERNVWTSALLSLMKSGNYLYEFRKAVKQIYPRALLYESNDLADEFLLYLGVKETKDEQKRIKMLVRFLVPIQAKVHIFYDRHFGIIGIDETMELDEMMIF